MTCPCCSRRAALLGGLSLAGVGALTGCDPSATMGSIGSSLVSPEQERQLGDQAFAQIKAKTPASADPALNAQVQRVAGRIVAASGSPIPPSRWEFVVFDSPEVNAFALPGGHIGVYKGILGVAQDDAQLATVLGHEVGHVIARHSAQRVGASSVGSGIAILTGALAGATLGVNPNLATQAVGAGAQMGVLAFSRGQELDADKLGLTYMARAGYDPAESIAFWQRMSDIAKRKGGGGGFASFLATHPADDVRIAQLRQLLPAAETVYRGRGVG